MSDGGFAKAWRKRWDHPLFKDKVEAAVWAWMCDTARWKRHTFQTRFGLVTLERGQILISQRSVAEDFRMGRQQVRRLFDTLEISGMISQNSTHKAAKAGTIVTIEKYNEYQSFDVDNDSAPTQGQPIDQPITNPRPTQDQPTREEREEGEEAVKRPSRRRALPPECPDYDDRHSAVGHWEQVGVSHLLEVDHEAEMFRSHHEAKGSKMADWSAAWRTWYRNAAKFKLQDMARRGEKPTVVAVNGEAWLSDEEWELYVGAFARKGPAAWPKGKCGAVMPDDPERCRAPDHILRKHGFLNDDLFERARG